MTRVRWLAAVGASALVWSAGQAPRAAIAAPVAGEVRNEAMVVSLALSASAGRAELVIGINGTVRVHDFVLREPDRIVLDISNATLGLRTGDVYDAVPRGPVRNIRYSQWKWDVVRVVLTLDAPEKYSVVRTGREVRVAVEGAGEFTAWRVGGASGAPVVAAPPREASQAPVQAVSRPPAPPTTSSAASRPTTAVTPTPAASTAAAVTPPASARTAAPSGFRQQPQPRITVQWEDANITDVLAMFATFTGLTIIPSSSVKGNITANIVDQPWDVALRAVLNAHGFDATVDPNGIIIVDSMADILARRATDPLQTRRVRLYYSRATAVAPMVREILSKECPRMGPSLSPGETVPQVAAMQQPTAGGTMTATGQCPARGSVTADTLTNTLNITDIATALDELEAFARSLDERQPQVNIKAKIILVDRSSLEALGVRYDLGSRNQFFNDMVPRLNDQGQPITGPGRILLGGNTVSAIANAAQRVPGAALQLVYSTAIGNFDFTTFIEALQQVSLLDVQAEPSVTALNNRTVNITAGTEVPIRVIDAATGGGAGNFPRANVQMRQTGVLLTVTPQITANRQVQMNVRVENSDVQFTATDVGAVFPTQTVISEILVADGETAVMGGLTQTSVRLTRSGIPVLVDLPLIGRLFGVTQRQETRRDLLILITPHIIDEGVGVGSNPRE